MVKKMEEVYTFGSMVRNMTVTGKMERKKGMEFIVGLMELTIAVNGKKVKKMDLANSFFLMEPNTLESISQVKNTELVTLHLKTELEKLENGKEE